MGEGDGDRKIKRGLYCYWRRGPKGSFGLPLWVSWRMCRQGWHQPLGMQFLIGNCVIARLSFQREKTVSWKITVQPSFGAGSYLLWFTCESKIRLLILWEVRGGLWGPNRGPSDYGTGRARKLRSRVFLFPLSQSYFEAYWKLITCK